MSVSVPSLPSRPFLAHFIITTPSNPLHYHSIGTVLCLLSLCPSLPPLSFPSLLFALPLLPPCTFSLASFFPLPLPPFSLSAHRQSLYDNEQKVQDAFLQFWQTVAAKFRGNPNVLGYELINEPWAGDVYRHPDQLSPRELCTLTTARDGSTLSHSSG